MMMTISKETLAVACGALGVPRKYRYGRPATGSHQSQY